MVRFTSRLLGTVLVSSVMVITLVPSYLLLTGRYSLIRNPRDTSTPPLRRFDRLGGTREEDEMEEDGTNLPVHTLDFQSELERVFSEDNKNPRASFEQVVLLSTLLPKLTNISRIKTPSPETFRNYIAPVGLPVIFTDMLEGQQLGHWTWDYVRGRWGDTVFHNTRQGNYSTKVTSGGKHYIHRVSVKLSDFIDVVLGRRRARGDEEALYITKQKVIPAQDLETDFYYPPFYPGPHKNCYLEPTAWIGAPGTFTQGHIDSKDNFAYQILGEKRWTIFSPVDYPNLYYTETRGSLEWSAALSTLGGVDLQRYPLYARTVPITFTMKPGEVLYLPRGWTHTVENVTPALMINTWRYGPAHITWFWAENNREEIKKRCF